MFEIQFNNLAALSDNLWQAFGELTPYNAFIIGLGIWFVLERILSCIRTPIIKAVSMLGLLLTILVIMTLFEGMSAYSTTEDQHPKILSKHSALIETLISD